MANVFEKTSLAGMAMQNRIIRSATHEGLADEHGRALKELTYLYERLARNKVGAIITGCAVVQKNGRMTPNMLMFDTDEYINGYKALNARIKEFGVPLIIQLVHGGGQASPRVTGEAAVAPSAIKVQGYENQPQELSEPDIEQIINSFVQAISRAKEAGFSGIQLHATHGYLLSEFLSPHYNRRQGRWGGSTENRFRIVGEILKRARNGVGNYPILIKISATDLFEDGTRVDEAIGISKLLQTAGCDAIEVSCGNTEFSLLNSIRTAAVPVEPMLAWIPKYAGLPPEQKEELRAVLPKAIKIPPPLNNYNVNAACQIKAQVDIPVIVVGGIRTLKDIEEIISGNKADYVSMSRPFIIEPDIVRKFMEQKRDQSLCISCGYCLMGIVSNPVKCHYGKMPES